MHFQWYEAVILVWLVFSSVVTLIYIIRGIFREWDERENDRDSLGR